MPLSICLPGVGGVVGEARSAFPLLEEASSSVSFSVFSFSTALESTLHLPSLESSLETTCRSPRHTPRRHFQLLQGSLLRHPLHPRPSILLDCPGSPLRSLGRSCGHHNLRERGEDYRRKSLWCTRSRDRPPEVRSGGSLPAHGSDVPSQHLPLILSQVGQGHKDEGH